MGTFERLSEKPRTVLWDQPTPLEALPNLAREIGANNVWVKRDDCNGLSFGGNKVRQMEYYLGEALSQKADTLLITGAVQSNFVRTAAAACAKLGLRCHVQLEQRVNKTDPLYTQSGNVLLDKILGATLHYFPEGEDEAGADQNLEKIADRLREDGYNPYIVHLHPAHPPLGALGYLDCAKELSEQMTTLHASVDTVFTPSGSGNTHGGLVYGLRAAGEEVRVIGSCVRRNTTTQIPRLEERLQQIARLLDEEPVAYKSDLELTDQFLHPGYGQPGTETLEAISLAAKLEALILDPVYTGKSMAALIEYSRNNTGENLIYLHTGGGPSIFGYGNGMLGSIE